MTTRSSADVSLKLRWENALTRDPPTSPLYDTYTSAVGYTLKSFADADGTSIYPTLAQVARAAVCSPDTVSDRRKRLVDLGMIEIVSAARNGRATVYRLCEPNRWRSDVEAKPKPTPGPKPAPEPEPRPASGPNARVAESAADAALLVAIGALTKQVDVDPFYKAHSAAFDGNPVLLAALGARHTELLGQPLRWQWGG